MNASIIDIGRYAKIPLHVARADVSEMTKALWRELAFCSRPQNPSVWLRQETMAAKLKRSTRTIRRLIKELEMAGLIEPNGMYEGRYKKYKLDWYGTPDTDAQSIETQAVTANADDQAPQIPVASEAPPPLLAKEEGDDEIVKLLAKHGETWKQKFACLDGLSGWPSIVECIEQALNHSARKK